MSSRMRMVSSSTSASETLISPATTRPLSSTRSSTSTRPVDRPCPSVNGVGIGSVFYENSAYADVIGNWDPDRPYLSNDSAILTAEKSVAKLRQLQQSPTLA